jgi:exopolyphosphatase/guanosine-5'-triphosphate,3'-diphosphate pyrophosphatase
MRVGVVDIGTNSMRLLITDGDEDVMRLERVTGLGRGVDRTGVLSEEAVAVSLEALEDYGHLLDEAGVARRKAIATSA